MCDVFMLLTLWEVLQAILLSLILGWLFSDLLPSMSERKRFALSIASVAPAVILHELAHKLVALSFGLHAVFTVPWVFVLIAVILKLARSPFLFLVPAFVAIQGVLTPFTSMLIAAAGPGMNLFLALIFTILERSALTEHAPYDTLLFITLSRNVNLFLGIFNLLPIPGFDGWKVFTALITLLTG